MRYHDVTGDLLVISRNKMSEKRAQMMQEMYYRNIAQRLGPVRRMKTSLKTKSMRYRMMN